MLSHSFAWHLKHLCYLHIENHTLDKLWHLDLPRYLGLTPTFKWVRLIPIADFPCGPRPCHLGLPSFVFRPNRRFRLVQGLSVSGPMPWALSYAPSLTNTYVICVYVKLEVGPNPTLRLKTQVCHRGHPMVVQTWASTRQAPTLKGPPRRAC
jgi:hypothetical protein